MPPFQSSWSLGAWPTEQHKSPEATGPAAPGDRDGGRSSGLTAQRLGAGRGTWGTPVGTAGGWGTQDVLLPTPCQPRLISLEPGVPCRLSNDNCILLICQPLIKMPPGKAEAKDK